LEKTITQPPPRRALDPGSTAILARVAHEMRQPLSAVSAAITVIKSDADLERRDQACRVIERQYTRLSRLVEDLVVVARTGRDFTALNRDTIDLHCMLADLTEALRPSAALKAQQFDVLL
jgi:signal transduction histidine kinase